MEYEKGAHNLLSGEVIGAGIEVHRELGPGLLESAYEACLVRELELRNISHVRQLGLPIEYKGLVLDCGYRLDLLVNDELIVELKSVEQLTDLHKAQLLTYLRLSKIRLGLLINFNVPLLRDGIIRLVQD
jgi:GxxExxY protein